MSELVSDGVVDASALITPITMDDALGGVIEYDSSSSLSIPAFALRDDASYLFRVSASNGGDFEVFEIYIGT